jgi:hypothetical protein
VEGVSFKVGDRVLVLKKSRRRGRVTKVTQVARGRLLCVVEFDDNPARLFRTMNFFDHELRPLNIVEQVGEL